MTQQIVLTQRRSVNTWEEENISGADFVVFYDGIVFFYFDYRIL